MKLKLISILLMFALIGCTTPFYAEQSVNISPSHPEYTLVKVISRPVTKKNEIVPSRKKSFRRLAIVSNLLPHGVWEMGPDNDGKIITTNTVNNLSAWHIHKATQQCIELGGEYIKEQMVGVNGKSLAGAIKIYEESWVGQKYSRYSQNENYAVESVIFAAGGSIRK